MDVLQKLKYYKNYDLKGTKLAHRVKVMVKKWYFESKALVFKKILASWSHSCVLRGNELCASWNIDSKLVDLSQFFV